MTVNYAPLREAMEALLKERGVSQQRTHDVLESGFYPRDWGNLSGETWTSMSDMMYGNKQWSSSFPIDRFIAYISGQYEFPALPAFTEYTARSRTEKTSDVSHARNASISVADNPPRKAMFLC